MKSARLRHRDRRRKTSALKRHPPVVRLPRLPVEKHLPGKKRLPNRPGQSLRLEWKRLPLSRHRRKNMKSRWSQR
ncbi:hypothetical protein RvVAR031_18450 [Agrobacterium vitis]|nr:hypothetical protein RvVAR031_18450 [Agrobacterium vitis]